jgi:MobA/VirD2-like, nuclease domain
MIIVVNPGGAPGHSFKGLSAYCSHDAGTSDSSERVAWTATRNIEAEPEEAWKVMAATAGMAENLKSEANVQSGRKTKLGPVMHMVVSFVDGEPTDQKSVERQIDGMLGKLGVDPAQMRSKSKPKRRQFADEHQVQMWAHEDTSSFHVHLSINTVHPEHGTRLPTSNNFRKLQRWALGYTKAHGTDHHTPAREENVQARRQGEYVKHPDRPHRRAFDESQRLEEHLGSIAKTKAILKEQKAKDRAVYEAGRALKQAYKVEQGAVEARYLKSLADAARLRRRDDNKAKAEIREQFRPVWRDLADKQVHEVETFEALEASFFGRTKNVLKTVRQTGADDGSNLARAFRIISNANDRRKQLEISQTRERNAVQSHVDTSIALAAQSSKTAEAERLSSARNLLKEEMTKLRDWRAEALAEHGAAWRKRNAERRAVIAGSEPGNDHVARPGEAFAKASAGNAEADDQIDAIIEEFGLDFEQAAHDARDILNDDQSFNGKQKK